MKARRLLWEKDRPRLAVLPLSIDKAALRAMCLALHEELKTQNVFVGTLNEFQTRKSCVEHITQLFRANMSII